MLTRRRVDAVRGRHARSHALPRLSARVQALKDLVGGCCKRIDCAGMPCLQHALDEEPREKRFAQTRLGSCGPCASLDEVPLAGVAPGACDGGVPCAQSIAGIAGFATGNVHGRTSLRLGLGLLNNLLAV